MFAPAPRHTPGIFGVLLLRHRAAAGLSQSELGERAALSSRGISDLERGLRRCPHPATVRRLADALALEANERQAFVAAARNKRSTPEPELPREHELADTLLELLLLASSSRFSREHVQDMLERLLNRD
jgi:transcriptional regulator with XRE-family HTH domain